MRTIPAPRRPVRCTSGTSSPHVPRLSASETHYIAAFTGSSSGVKLIHCVLCVRSTGIKLLLDVFFHFLEFSRNSLFYALSCHVHIRCVDMWQKRVCFTHTIDQFFQGFCLGPFCFQQVWLSESVFEEISKLVAGKVLWKCNFALSC